MEQLLHFAYNTVVLLSHQGFSVLVQALVRVQVAKNSTARYLPGTILLVLHVYDPLCCLCLCNRHSTGTLYGTFIVDSSRPPPDSVLVRRTVLLKAHFTLC